ncbi:MAG: hypothetical protein IPP37_19785 [Saprospiraceae bacterium]|nr:hypothetical protein [Saprospiraceae bacterium]
MSQRFDEMPDSSTTPIRIITNGLWPSLPSTPVNKLRAKRIPNNEIKKWLQEQNYPQDFFHVQLVKAYRSQINSQLTFSAFTKKMTAGNNVLFVLLLPINALLLFPLLYKKKIFYYDSMIFTIHTNTWIPLFQSMWMWVLILMIGVLHVPKIFFINTAH